MKKILMIMVALAVLGAGAFAEAPAAAAAPAGVDPLLIQAAFYTPTYQCIYLEGTDELKTVTYTPNAWCNYAIEVGKKTVHYDGMGGNYKNINVVRIKSNAKKASSELVIYIDNVTVKDPSGKPILTLDFENGDPAGVFTCMGKPLAEHGTVVEKDGKKCFLMHLKTEAMYGYNGAEVQWSLTENPDTKTWDFTTGAYSVSFDYLIAVAPDGKKKN